VTSESRSTVHGVNRVRLDYTCYYLNTAYKRCGCGEIGIRGGLKTHWGFPRCRFDSDQPHQTVGHSSNAFGYFIEPKVWVRKNPQSTSLLIRKIAPPRKRARLGFCWVQFWVQKKSPPGHPNSTKWLYLLVLRATEIHTCWILSPQRLPFRHPGTGLVYYSVFS
jgi:hypothetical protein